VRYFLKKLPTLFIELEQFEVVGKVVGVGLELH
jgi:hypothetical protein